MNNIYFTTTTYGPYVQRSLIILYFDTLWDIFPAVFDRQLISGESQKYFRLETVIRVFLIACLSLWFQDTKRQICCKISYLETETQNWREFRETHAIQNFQSMGFQEYISRQIHEVIKRFVGFPGTPSLTMKAKHES